MVRSSSVNVALKEKQRGRILRAHVVPVWVWVSQTLLPAEAKSYCSEVRNLVLVRKYDEALTRAGAFWLIASQAMLDALSKDTKKTTAALGGPAVAADAEDMALLLKMGEQVVAIQTLLPKPTPSLGEDLLWG